MAIKTSNSVTKIKSQVSYKIKRYERDFDVLVGKIAELNEVLSVIEKVEYEDGKKHGNN